MATQLPSTPSGARLHDPDAYDFGEELQFMDEQLIFQDAGESIAQRTYVDGGGLPMGATRFGSGSSSGIPDLPPPPTAVRNAIPAYGLVVDGSSPRMAKVKWMGLGSLLGFMAAKWLGRRRSS